MVLGNRVSQLFKTAKNKFSSFIQKKTDTKVLKAKQDEISEVVDKENRKSKSRWSNSNWLARILGSTSNKLSVKEREILARNWFGNFSPVGKFQFRRGAKTKKASRYA